MQEDGGGRCSTTGTVLKTHQHQRYCGYCFPLSISSSCVPSAPVGTTPFKHSSLSEGGCGGASSAPRGEDMEVRCGWCWWQWGALLAAATAAGLVDAADQEVRVPWGGSVTLLCSYNVSQHWLPVKTWYRQDHGGLVPLGRTDGWVASGHRGRLSVSDLRHSSQVRVVMADVTDGDTGTYSCAVGRRIGVDVIHRIALQVSHGPVPDQDVDGANKTSERWAVMPEHVGRDPTTPQGALGMWGLLRWLLLGLMASGIVLSSLITAIRQGAGREQMDVLFVML
ncbi:hypothetical protein GN956_G9649 [Arapaima gigas]